MRNYKTLELEEQGQFQQLALPQGISVNAEKIGMPLDKNDLEDYAQRFQALEKSAQEHDANWKSLKEQANTIDANTRLKIVLILCSLIPSAMFLGIHQWNNDMLIFGLVESMLVLILGLSIKKAIEREAEIREKAHQEFKMWEAIMWNLKHLREICQTTQEGLYCEQASMHLQDARNELNSGIKLHNTRLLAASSSVAEYAEAEEVHDQLTRRSAELRMIADRIVVHRTIPSLQANILKKDISEDPLARAIDSLNILALSGSAQDAIGEIEHKLLVEQTFREL